MTTPDTAPLVAPYTAEDRGRWRKLLLAKGQEVSRKLEEILNGKDVKLDDLSLYGDGGPAELPERRLRRYLDLLMKRLRSVDHPRFGFDPARGEFLTVPELDAMPWIEVEPL